ncbi:response regulator transcription factor [Endothiovibrio diazotrophicus]
MDRLQPQRILLVDSNEPQRRRLATPLANHGYVVEEVHEGAHLIALMRSLHQYDAVLLELELCDEDGLALLRKLRDWSDLPVIIVSSLHDEARRVAAFELGADDFVPRPYFERELLLRLKRLLHSRQEQQPKVIKIGPLTLDHRRREVTVTPAGALNLTASEFDLLAVLMQARGEIVSRLRLAERVGREFEGSSPESIAVLIYRLRRKLAQVIDGAENQVIVTVPRFGYRLSIETLHEWEETPNRPGFAASPQACAAGP